MPDLSYYYFREKNPFLTGFFGVKQQGINAIKIQIANSE
ncbi:hypothetical protein D1BOALGB6SA_7894 [Olavius sp. associated proteobacterium Delta 1]|nr:hypothetical protein D1BOALGB6SA_7894 [Olavius sp. associated proteobacterium Delta 1]